MNPWETLGVEHDVAVADLRRRYAALIKEFRPESHPQDFARIREAYEVVLPLARRREAAQAEDDVAAPMPMPSPAVVEAAPAPAAAAPDVAALPEPHAQPDLETGPPPVIRVDRLPDIDATPPPPAAERIVTAESEPEAAVDAAGDADDRALADHFRRFHALAESAPAGGDAALLPELRALLAARTQATLDDCQALEFALMRWFLEADVPALTLLFETGRAFDWHHHESRLSAWLPPGALRHMERLLSLSRDLVYARHFSANPWLRALHSTRAHWAPIARQAPLREARRWAERWQQGCEDSGQHALARGLNARTLASLNGRELLVTDLLVGLMCASTEASLEGMALWLLIGTALTFALRQLALWVLRRPEGNRMRKAFIGILENRSVSIVVSVVAGMVGALLLQSQGTSESPPAQLALGGALLAPILLFALWMLWRLAQYVELYVTEGLAWRDAVDRLEFDRFVRGRAVAGDAAPYGLRLGWRQRLAAIPEALRLQQVEIATRARPALPQRFGRLSTLRGQYSVPRLMWFGAWILFAILRLFHVIGSSH